MNNKQQKFEERMPWPSWYFGVRPEPSRTTLSGGSAQIAPKKIHAASE